LPQQDQDSDRKAYDETGLKNSGPDWSHGCFLLCHEKKVAVLELWLNSRRVSDLENIPVHHQRLLLVWVDGAWAWNEVLEAEACGDMLDDLVRQWIEWHNSLFIAVKLVQANTPCVNVWMIGKNTLDLIAVQIDRYNDNIRCRTDKDLSKWVKLLGANDLSFLHFAIDIHKSISHGLDESAPDNWLVWL
jgi:hypothetical protein